MNESICLYGGYIYYPKEYLVKFDENSIINGSIGGAESWLIYSADMFAKAGFTVTVVCDCEKYHFSETGVEYVPVKDSFNILKDRHFRYLISNREFSGMFYYKSDLKLIMLHNMDFDLFDEEDKSIFNEDSYFSICYLSEYQKKQIINKHGLKQTHKLYKVIQGIDWSLYGYKVQKKNKMVWSSNKRRGLKYFIENVFPLIKREIPDFELDVCTYLDEFNGEYEGIDGVNMLGTLNKRELALKQCESKIWVYPNTGKLDNGDLFGETFCLSAVENAAAGNAIIVANKHGFSDTLCGYEGFVGDECFDDDLDFIANDEKLTDFANILAERAIMLLRDEEYRKHLANNARDICSQYTFENAIKYWICLLKMSYGRCNLSEYMVDELNTRMVFHIWVPVIKTTFYENLNKVHFSCIRRFKDRFKESVIVISAEDVKDPYIEKIKQDIYSLGLPGNITIKIKQNSMLYREAVTFNDEIMFKMDKLDGITFFSHNKGTSRYEFSLGCFRNLVRWVTYMYYMNLNDFNQVRHHLSTPFSVTYGTLLYKYEYERDVRINENGWCYLGSLQWINTKKLYELYGRNKTVYDTSDAEMFIPNNFVFDEEKFRSFRFSRFDAGDLFVGDEFLGNDEKFDYMLWLNAGSDNDVINGYNAFNDDVIKEIWGYNI